MKSNTVNLLVTGAGSDPKQMITDPDPGRFKVAGTFVGTQSNIRNEHYRTKPDFRTRRYRTDPGIGISVIGLRRALSDMTSDIGLDFYRCPSSYYYYSNYFFRCWDITRTYSFLNIQNRIKHYANGMITNKGKR
jgi:hypothetical protein